jgi:hypothetical protein
MLSCLQCFYAIIVWVLVVMVNVNVKVQSLVNLSSQCMILLQKLHHLHHLHRPDYLQDWFLQDWILQTTPPLQILHILRSTSPQIILPTLILTCQLFILHVTPLALIPPVPIQPSATLCNLKLMSKTLKNYFLLVFFGFLVVW